MPTTATLKTSLIVLGLAAGLAGVSQAQYGGDPSRSYSDQMVLDHMNNRRLEERLKSRPHWKQQTKKQKHQPTRTRAKTGSNKAGSTKAAAAQRVAEAAHPAPTGSLSLSQDMFSDFGNDDSRGYALEVKLAPQDKTGRTITQRLQFNSHKGRRSGSVPGVPAGRYILTARSIDANGRARPAQVGTECGSPTEPQDGNFAAAWPVTMAAIKNQWGNLEVRCQEAIWFRP